MTLPAGWKAETETVDRIRLEVPVEDREKVYDYLASEDYEATRHFADCLWEPGSHRALRVDIAAVRPSRSVPLDELLAWLGDIEERRTVRAERSARGSESEARRYREANLIGELRSRVAEKWGEGRAEEGPSEVLEIAFDCGCGSRIIARMPWKRI